MTMNYNTVSCNKPNEISNIFANHFDSIFTPLANDAVTTTHSAPYIPPEPVYHLSLDEIQSPIKK